MRAAFRRTPADEEAKRGTTRLDLVGHVSQPNSLSNVWMIALTYGKLESGLAINADKSYWTPLKDFVQRTWLRARDEGQQAGTPVVSRHSAHIRPMWVGDLKQQVGGLNKEQEEVQKKRCGLRMLTGSQNHSP